MEGRQQNRIDSLYASEVNVRHRCSASSSSDRECDTIRGTDLFGGRLSLLQSAQLSMALPVSARRQEERAGEAPLLNQLPRELLVLTIAHHMHEGSDVMRLSLASRSFFGLVHSPELVAAWLWKRHGNEATFMAMQKNDLAVLRQLVEVQRAVVNALRDDGDDDDGLLHGASREGKLDYVSYLLSVPGIQANLRASSGWTALHCACSKGHQAVVHELLQHPAVNVNTKSNNGLTALGLASFRNHPDIVLELLCHSTIDVNQEGGGPGQPTSLHVACILGHARVVRELVRHPGIDVNKKCDRDMPLEAWSALHWGLYAGHSSCSEDDQLATLRELLKHPCLDRGDMKAALQQAQADSRLYRCAEAIAEALRD